MKKFGSFDSKSAFGGDLFGGDFGGSLGGAYKGPKYTPCYESHKPLDIAGFKVYGGSCSNPIVQDADIYVGLDHSMRQTNRRFPWHEGEEVFFPIQDMQAPNNPTEFKKMVQWLSEQVVAGKKVHIGCIGGHGRTGTVLAALVYMITGEHDAITYVRNNYCKKAVETNTQIGFLVKHFGIKEVTGSKKAMPWGDYATKKDGKGGKGGKAFGSGSTQHYNDRYVVKELQEVVPVASRGNIWGSNRVPVFDKVS